MAELRLIADRLISGRGVLKIPEDAQLARYYIMYADVIRRPINEYLNFDWNPPQSVYARLNYRRDGYVQQSDILRYPRESRTYVNDVSGQNLRAIKCAYDGILETFVNLSIAIPFVFPISVNDLIKDYESLALGWDEILFDCYSSTALQIRFYALDYDVCNPDRDDTNYPPPPPPPLPPVPPDTSIGSITPPYDGENDDGNTVPFPDDDFETPGSGDCVAYDVVINVFGNFDPNPAVFTKNVWGPVGELRIDNPSAGEFTTVALILDCRGDRNVAPCQPETSITINTAQRRDYTSWEIVSITEV